MSCVVVQGLISSVAEVVAVSGFVFGIACKLPPSLVILLLNGVFWVVIARHFLWDILCKRINQINHQMTGYEDIDEYFDRKCTLCMKRRLVPLLELVAFLMQLGALISIPIILTHTEHIYNGKNKMYFLIPITLTFISITWSGWLQKYFAKPGIRSTETGERCTARLKSGEYLSCMIIYVAQNVYNGTFE